MEVVILILLILLILCVYKLSPFSKKSDNIDQYGVINELGDLKRFKLYRHYRNKKPYIVIGFAKRHASEALIDSVIYKAVDSNVLYVRDVDNFKQSFNLIEEGESK